MFADADNDGDVDQADFAVLQSCYAGTEATIPTTPEYCVCFDVAGANPGRDGHVSLADVEAFEACASGPGLPAACP